MPLTYSEEMLSAYLDGEATPEERALVERLLEEKPELQEQLTVLSDLSQSVQNLPRETAPTDFASSVLNELNQRRPAPSKLQSKDVAASTKTSKRSPRFWISSLVAMSVLVVAGVLLNTSLQPATSDSEMALMENISNSSAEGAVADVSFDDSLAKSSEGMVAETFSLSAETEDRSSSFGMPMEPASKTLPGMSLAAPSPKVVTLNREEITLRLSSLQDSPDVGDELSILTKNGGTPILVDFVVVDVQKSWNHLQVLLKNHSVEPVMVDADDNLNSSNPQREMISIYLDLDEPALESVLGQVNALDAVVFLSDEMQPAMNSSLVSAAEEKKIARPQSLAFQSSKKLQEEPKSLASSSPLAPKQDASQLGRTDEKQFRFDIKEARSIQKAKASENSPMPADAHSRLARSSNEVLADASGGLRQTLPPSPAIPERLLKRKNLGEKSEAKETARRKPKTKLPTPDLPASAGQSSHSAKPLDKAENPSQKSTRAAKKSTERVRALLILRSKKE